MKQLSITFLVFFVCLATGMAGAQQGPVNLDLEQGTVGQPPPGWLLPPICEQNGYHARLTNEKPNGGKSCALLFRDAQAAVNPNLFGNLMQSIDASPYRGKRIRLRAAVRFESGKAGGQAQLWMRVDRNGGKMGFIDNMSNRPIKTAEWHNYEIVGDVADDAEGIAFGMLLIGDGRAWLDDVSITDLGKAAGKATEAPRPFTDRGLVNMTAFARLLGYVRHFHPSDAVAAVNWDAFAIENVRRVENAKDPDELVHLLELLFRPIAPTVRIFPTGRRPAALPAELTPPKGAPNLQVIAWRHYGYGSGAANSLYHSERIRKAAPGGKVPEGISDPGKPYVANLGGGVSCQVPLALWADAKGALPHTTMPEQNALSTVSATDRAVRLADVILAWNILQHFYPYFDVVHTDWPGALHTALTSAATDPDEAAFLKTLQRLIAALNDGHGAVYGPGQNGFEPPVSWRWIEDKLVVFQVDASGPKELKPGDVILTFDGKPSADALAQAESLISGATPQWRRWRAEQNLGIGEQNTPLKVTVQRGSDPPFALTLSRSLSLAEVYRQHKLEEVRPANYSEIRPGIVYVEISKIRSKNSPAAPGAEGETLEEALPKLEKAEGLICDLRGYPSGDALALLGYLTDKPITSALWNVPIITIPDGKQVTYDVSRWPPFGPTAPRLHAKVAFLTDGRAISYAESYMAIVQYYKLGEIVGSTTAGTNGNINPVTLPGNYNFVFTGMKVLRHDGGQHHGVGIAPTIPINPTIEGIAEGRDEVLEKAIQVVQSK